MFWKGFATALALVAGTLFATAYLQGGLRMPPPLNLTPPPIKEPGADNSAQQAQPGEPTLPPRPALPPPNRTQNQTPDQADPGKNEGDWNLDALARRALMQFWGALPADKSQLVFNSLLVVVGFLQWRVYKTQAKIMRETREISLAALGRPHIFFHFAAHSFEDWREGKTEMWFGFRLVNYGTAPAIVRHVVTRAFLSRGPGTQEDRKYISIKEFPEEKEFVQFVAQGTRLYVKEAKFDDINFEVFFERAQSFRDHPFIIAPRERSGMFGVFAPVGRPTKPRTDRSQQWHETYLYEVTSDCVSDGGWVRPWLAGQIVYEDTFGHRHHTNFCVSANSDGTVDHKEGGAYDQRT